MLQISTDSSVTEMLNQCCKLLPIIVSLKCSMDVQSSDGYSLLLKYLTSYVSKMKDHQMLKGLSVYKKLYIT